MKIIQKAGINFDLPVNVFSGLLQNGVHILHLIFPYKTTHTTDDYTVPTQSSAPGIPPQEDLSACTGISYYYTSSGRLFILIVSFPIGLRAASVIFPEAPAEIRRIGKSHLLADHGYFHVGGS